jgi:glycerol-3-phosphate dehydrogenase subunit B
LAAAWPAHPYAILGPERIRQALVDFLVLAGQLDQPYTTRVPLGDEVAPGALATAENFWLPSPAGVPRPALLAPLSQATGDLRRGEPFVVVGFRGLRDFYPELIAENLNKSGYLARPAWLPLELITEMHDRNTVQLANAMQTDARARALGSELRRLVRRGERIAVPALMGMDRHRQVMDELEAAAGAAVCEIPTLPPSVPGIRLDTALRRKLAALGVRADVNMNVVDCHVEGDRVSWVATETSGRPLLHRAKAVLLATGGILGGGIVAGHTGSLEETVLGLPVAGPGDRTEWFRRQFLDPAGHPIFRCGVAVDAAFRPIDAEGRPVYDNVFAAGALLAYADPIRERSLEGLAIATGVAAARSAVAYLAMGVSAGSVR